MEREQSPKPRILYIWPYLEWGGAQIYFAGMIKHVRDRYDICVAMPEGSDDKIRGYFQQLGARLVFFGAHLDNAPTASFWRKVARRFINARCSLIIARFLTKQGFSNTLLHADFGPWAEFALLFYLCLRADVFITLHIAIPKLSRIRHLLYLLKFKILCLLPRFHLLASNEEMRDSLRQYVGDKFLQTVPITYTAVDDLEIRQTLSEKRDRSLICRQYNIPSDRLLVFSLGQLVHRKGYLVLIEAVRRLREENPNLFFVWIGDGYLKLEIEARIRSEGLRDTVRVIPPKEIGPVRLDLLRLLGIADLFVHPSFSEGLPIALLEAMALEKACVASRVNAIPEAITDGVSGLLVSPGDPAGFAGAIAALAADPDRRAAFAKEGQAIVFSRFTEAIAAKVMAACYDSCFSNE